MKKKEFENALCHLLQADHHFRCVPPPCWSVPPYWQAPPINVCVVDGSSKCGSALLRSVDNFAVLQLDIVWCYRALKALSCLDDARKRLQSAEDCFLQCYGRQQQRLLMIKVPSSTTQTARAPTSRQSHHSTVARATPAERTSCSCGSTSSRVSCPTLKETTFWLNNN